jgi:hypothetical protein
MFPMVLKLITYIFLTKPSCNYQMKSAWSCKRIKAPFLMAFPEAAMIAFSQEVKAPFIMAFS